MSNRLLGILIILGFIGVAYIYYMTSYLPNKNLSSIKETKELKNEVNLEKVEIKKKEESKSDLQEEKSEISSTLNGEGKKQGNDYSEVEEKQKNIEKIENKQKEIKQTVLGSDDFSFSASEKIIKDLKNNKEYLLDLNLDIEYVKIGKNNSEFLIKTKPGTFVYSTLLNSSEYFIFFEDFVYHKDGYLGIIKKDDKRRLNNLGFSEKTKDLIFYYDPNSKEKRIVLESDLDLNKIYKIDYDILFEDNQKNQYKLNNF